MCVSDSVVAESLKFILPADAPVGTMFTFCPVYAGIDLRTPVVTDGKHYEMGMGSGVSSLFAFTSTNSRYLKALIEVTITSCFTFIQVNPEANKQSWWLLSSGATELANWTLAEITP